MKTLFRVAVVFCMYAGQGRVGIAQAAASAVPGQALSLGMGTPLKAIDYVNAGTPPSGNLFPALNPWNFIHIVTHRNTYYDSLSAMSVFMHYQHGGANYEGNNGAISGASPNLTASYTTLVSNTDGQGGGLAQFHQTHYGHGDTIGIEMDNMYSGCSRGFDECAKAFRMRVGPHGDNWGITIGTLTTDSKGEAVMKGTQSGDGVPLASVGHSLAASFENGPILDTNPAKIYSVGNAQLIAKCPPSLPGYQAYMCVTGDAATQWTAHFGVSRLTTLTVAITDARLGGVDPFAAGPVCTDAHVADASIFAVGEPFTISATTDTFEQPTVLGIGTGTIRACFAKPHDSGVLVAVGGAIGHALSFPVDDLPPGHNSIYYNSSTLHLAYPVAASLPGNVLAVWVDSAATGGPELKTSALMATTPTTPASFAPVLKDSQLAEWRIANYGNYQTASPETTGQELLPAPTISFAGSACVTLPTAHSVYLHVEGRHAAVAPVIDSAGSRCTALQASVQAVYPNPVVLYPMLWARSNRDETFVPTKYEAGVGITASTSGTMITGGTSAEFAVGDPVETGRWWQQYIASDVVMGTNMGKSGRNGAYSSIVIQNANLSALHAVTNLTDPAVYYGSAATRFGPGLHGEASWMPPVGDDIEGPIFYGRTVGIPQNRAGSEVAYPGAVERVICRFGGCTHGAWVSYDLDAFDTVRGQGSLRVDPTRHTLTYNDNGDGGAGTFAVSASQILVSGALKTCNQSTRGTFQNLQGGPGVADALMWCRQGANGMMAWKAVVVP